jgi:single-strand DNA-binding protein
MSVEINSVIIGGNITRDVVLKELAKGSKVASFSVAVNRTYIMGGQKNKEVAFIDVDVWGPMAENCSKYLKKGSPVVVTGRLKQDQWQTESGEKRSKLKIVAANVQFLSSGDRTSGSYAASEQEYSEPVGWEE